MLLLVKFDDKGELVFQSEKTKFKYQRFKEFHMRTGEFFTLSLQQVEKKTTEQQIRLFNAFVIKVANTTGNDFSVISKQFKFLLPEMATGELDLFHNPIVEIPSLDQLNNDQFNQFLTDCVNWTNNITGLNFSIYTDEQIGTVIKQDADI